MSMRLHHRFSVDPKVELRTDYGSSDGRTVEGRPYVWFSSLEDGRLRTRIKALPMSIEEAEEFVGQYLEYFREWSGTPDAVPQFHEFFVGCCFDTRCNTGKAPRRVTRPAMSSKVHQFFRKLRFWQKEAR